jgi:hypothetical protein
MGFTSWISYLAKGMRSFQSENLGNYFALYLPDNKLSAVDEIA